GLGSGSDTGKRPADQRGARRCGDGLFLARTLGPTGGGNESAGAACLRIYGRCRGGGKRRTERLLVLKGKAGLRARRPLDLAGIETRTGRLFRLGAGRNGTDRSNRGRCRTGPR